MKETLRNLILETGAIKVGFARATAVDEEECGRLKDFVEEGRHAGMEFLRRHIQLRRDPRNVLPEVKTLISCAFSYVPEDIRDPELPFIASYALGKDYHDVLRKKLSEVMERYSENHPSVWRVCVDSAPLPERWWALQAGIGKRGLNGSVIVEKAGGMCFLAEILTSLEFEPDAPSFQDCPGCGRCVENCPTGALRADGSLDARRCINYLTIEHRGEWDAEGTEAMATPEGRKTIFGCDRCLSACPFNLALPPSTIIDFRTDPFLAQLSREKVYAITQEDFSHHFRLSPIKRMKYVGLQRNLKNLREDSLP